MFTESRRLKRRERGFTLPELMTVVVIVGTLGAVAMFSLSKATSNPSSTALARNIQLSMMRARTEAVGDNMQRRLSCTPTVCTYQIAQSTGMAAPVAWTNADTIASGTHSTIWNVTTTTDNATNSSGAQMSGTGPTITFFPDGSASARTVYVADRTPGSAPANRFKVFVYRGTGMARMVSNW